MKAKLPIWKKQEPSDGSHNYRGCEMTIGDPHSRQSAVSGRSVALPLINQPVPYEAGDPALNVSVVLAGVGYRRGRLGALAASRALWWVRVAGCPSSCGPDGGRDRHDRHL